MKSFALLCLAILPAAVLANPVSSRSDAVVRSNVVRRSSANANRGKSSNNKGNGKGKGKDDKHHPGHGSGSGGNDSPAPHSNTTLYLPTIAVGDNKLAQPECWAMQPNFTVGTDPSLAGTLDLSLGDVQTASYVYFPEDFSAPLHGPGGNQYVVFLTGHATIWFEDSNATIPCPAGTNLVVVDNSTVSTGHRTNWTAGTSVMLVQFKNGVVPPHTIVDRSLC